MALDSAHIFGSEDDPRDFIADKIGHELLLTFVAVKIYFIIKRRIIMKDFRYHLVFRPAAHYYFISPHRMDNNRDGDGCPDGLNPAPAPIEPLSS